jgi:hypothetical protein
MLVLSILLLSLFAQPVFGEDIKVYAAAAFKAGKGARKVGVLGNILTTHPTNSERFL